MWSIENQCPQCGSPVVIEETDRIFACQFCRVRLFISSPDYLRYYLPAVGPEKPIYVPYWRMKGISFNVMPYEVSHALVDSSLIACKTVKLPATMGLRPQTMKLRFVSPDMKGEMIKPQFSFEEASSRINQGQLAVEKAASGIFNKDTVSPFVSAFIGESASLIYTPFYIRDNGVFDAVTGARAAGQGAEEFLTNGGAEPWQARFLSTLCPDCGADLAGDRKSTTLFCNGCYSAWGANTTGLSRVEFGIMPGGGDAATYLPFWRIKASVEGMALKSFGDLARIANLPSVIKTEWDNTELFFWQPAFKVNPPLFLRLGRELTLKQPQNGLETRINLRKAYPVTLSAIEAAEAIKISLAAVVSKKKEVYPVLKDLNIKATGSLLVYIPFEQKMTELVQANLGMSVLKNALDMGGNL